MDVGFGGTASGQGRGEYGDRSKVPCGVVEVVRGACGNDQDAACANVGPRAGDDRSGGSGEHDVHLVLVVHGLRVDRSVSQAEGQRAQIRGTSEVGDRGASGELETSDQVTAIVDDLTVTDYVTHDHACRLGRATSSPPQFGQTDSSASLQSAQNVHSKLQITAAPSTASSRPHRSHPMRISSTTPPSPQS
jgi:hypothetical protein